MERLLKSVHSLRLFFLVTAVIGWATAKHEKDMLKNSSPVAIAVFDALLTFIALLIFVLIKGGWSGFKAVAADIRNLAAHDMSLLGLMSLYGAGAGLVGASLLEHHGIVGYRLSGLFISLGVGAFAMYILSGEDASWDRWMGMALVGVGGYLVLRP